MPFPSIFEYVGYAPSRKDGETAPCGGEARRLTAGAALNTGDVVYYPASTPTAVNKSTTTSLYAGFAGVVIGTFRVSQNTNATGNSTGVAVGSGASILVQTSGYAFVVAGAAITAGDRVMASAAVAGRVLTATSPNSILGIALQAAANAGDVIKIKINPLADASFAATTDALTLGAAPPAAPGAVRIDLATYSNTVLSTVNVAATQIEIFKKIAAIIDATATAVFTVTVPNAAHSAALLVTVVGSLGAGGAIGANEATATNSYLISLTRTAGVDTDKDVSSAYGAAASAVVGAATVTATVDTSALTGAVGATQTFTVRVTITKSGGASDNHTCLAQARLLNANASGVTIA
jgi:hypothetical protein